MKKVLVFQTLIILLFCLQFTADSVTISSLMGNGGYDRCISGRVGIDEQETFNQISSEDVSTYCKCVSENTPYTPIDMFLMRATIGFYNPFAGASATSNMCKSRIQSKQVKKG